MTAAATTPAQLAATTFAWMMLEVLACASEAPSARRVGSVMDQKMAVKGTSLKSCTDTPTQISCPVVQRSRKRHQMFTSY